MKHHIIGTAGHIDHGKTSLVKMLTGIDCDTHKEEKQRGITINLGFSHLELPGGESAGIIDVPGHKDFVNTMIGGACGIDMVLLVIAADSGVMPQTHEHRQIISALGIKKGVVALTKSDLVDEELLEMAELEVTDFLAGTALRDAPIIKVSAVTGRGREELVQAIASMLHEIEPRDPGILFRMYIDRIFSVKGMGSVVTGSVMSGKVQVGQEVYLVPSQHPRLRVRSMERHGKTVDSVMAGDRAAINLTGLNREDFERGMMICDKPVEPCMMVDAVIRMFNTGVNLSVWSNILFLSGTFECQARMHLLNKDTVEGDEEAIVQIHLSKPAVLFSKDRFILRNTSEEITLGGGYIVEASPLHHRKRTSKLIDDLTELSHNILSENSVRELIQVTLKKEFRPCTPEELASRLHLRPEDVVAESGIPGSGFRVYASDTLRLLLSDPCDLAYRNKVVKCIAAHHERNSLFADGPEAAEILGKAGLTKTPNGRLYLDLLLKSLMAEGVLDTHQNTWIIKGYTPTFDQKTLLEIDWLEQEILRYGENKPVLAEIEEKAAQQRIPKQKIKTYLSWLTGKGKIKFCKTDFIHTDILDQYRNQLLSYLENRNQGIDIQEFKEVIPGSKRFRALLVDFLEAEKSIRLMAGSEVDTRLCITEVGQEIIKKGKQDADLS